jgi:hypothetical protein
MHGTSKENCKCKEIREIYRFVTMVLLRSNSDVTHNDVWFLDWTLDLFDAYTAYNTYDYKLQCNSISHTRQFTVCALSPLGQLSHIPLVVLAYNDGRSPS